MSEFRSVASASRRASAVRLAAIAVCIASCESSLIPSQGGTGTPLAPGSFAVVASDYRSTNLALRGPAGETLSSSLLSTASAAAGLSYALSGDVVLPSEALRSTGEVVLIDRFGTNVVTFVEPVSGRVRAQLAVGTGFEANPQDFLAFAPGLALVSRFGVDPRPGDTPLDGGDDVLVVDVGTPRLLDRIVFPRKVGVPARPGAFTALGPKVLVNLARISEDFAEAVDSDVAVLALDPPRLERIVALDGLRNCGKVAVSAGGVLALACSGLFDAARSRFDDVGAAIAVGVLEDDGLRVLAMWSASSLGATPSGSIAWLGEATLLFGTYGGGGTGDGVYALAADGTLPARAHAALTAYSLGALRCGRSDPARCFAPDASIGSIIEFSLDSSATPPTVRRRVVPAADVTGLPLRDLAVLR